MTTPAQQLNLKPAGRPAPRAQLIRAQARAELANTLRNGEQLLLMLVIPLAVLIGLSRASMVSLGPGPAVDIVTPGVLTLAIISTAFTSQAIGTGFERRYGVLKLLGATPLGRSGLLLAKTTAIITISIGQLVLLIAVAFALGWSPTPGWLLAGLLLLLGATCFSALGVLLAGLLRAEATLAAANALYLLLLVGGGVVLPLDQLPDAAANLVGLLPSAALGEGLRQVLQHGAGLGAIAGYLAVLVVWSAGAIALAARTFRWE